MVENPVFEWDEPYSGNCILSRVDPLDWVINNPWVEKEEFGEALYSTLASQPTTRAEKKQGCR